MHYQFSTKLMENTMQFYINKFHKSAIFINSKIQHSVGMSPFVKSFTTPNELHCVLQEFTEGLVPPWFRCGNQCLYPWNAGRSCTHVSTWFLLWVARRHIFQLWVFKHQAISTIKTWPAVKQWNIQTTFQFYIILHNIKYYSRAST